MNIEILYLLKKDLRITMAYKLKPGDIFINGVSCRNLDLRIYKQLFEEGQSELTVLEVNKEIFSYFHSKVNKECKYTTFSFQILKEKP